MGCMGGRREKTGRYLLIIGLGLIGLAVLTLLLWPVNCGDELADANELRISYSRTDFTADTLTGDMEFYEYNEHWNFPKGSDTYSKVIDIAGGYTCHRVWRSLFPQHSTENMRGDMGQGTIMIYGGIGEILLCSISGRDVIIGDRLYTLYGTDSDGRELVDRLYEAVSSSDDYIDHSVSGTVPNGDLN